MSVNQDPGPSQGNFHILHPSSRSLFRYWEGIRAERPAPGRLDIDLKQIPGLVPNLAILEHDSQAGIYRWRLAGTGICRLYRRELTGLPALRGLDRFETVTIGRFFAGTMHNQQPCVIRFNLHTDLNHLIGAELIGLPVYATNGRTVQLLAGFFPFRDADDIHYNGIARIELSAARSIWTENLPDQSSELLQRPSMMPFQVINGGRI